MEVVEVKQTLKSKIADIINKSINDIDFYFEKDIIYATIKHYDYQENFMFKYVGGFLTCIDMWTQ